MSVFNYHDVRDDFPIHFADIEACLQIIERFDNRAFKMPLEAASLMRQERFNLFRTRFVRGNDNADFHCLASFQFNICQFIVHFIIIGLFSFPFFLTDFGMTQIRRRGISPAVCSSAIHCAFLCQLLIAAFIRDSDNNITVVARFLIPPVPIHRGLSGVGSCPVRR